MKHRHNTENCNAHLFCRGDKIQAIEDRNIQYPMVMPKDCEDYRRLIREDTQKKYPGAMSIDNVKKVLKPANIFFKEKAFPADKKIIATDEEIDKWLGAHYGMSETNVPQF